MYYRRKLRPLALLLALMMLFSCMETAWASEQTAYPTYQEVYESIIALQSKYPEGMEFTNSTPYDLNHAYNWHGGPIKGANGGVGCAAFVLEASDEPFGNLPCRVLDQGEFTFEDVKVGDILRTGGSHFVIVLRKSIGGVIVAEANYNKTVHWGRAIDASEVVNSSFLVTRYPKNFVPSDAEDANQIISQGAVGELSWTLTNSGVLTIAGEGVIPDFTDSDRPSWETDADKIFTVVIEKGVTAVGGKAFGNLPAISISIPNSVSVIGNDAFYGCANLTSITLPEGITSIGERAFKGCTALTSVDLPSSLTRIGSGAFTSCENLAQVRFLPSSGDLSIGNNLFSQCWNLRFASLPNGITELTPGLFSSCKIIQYMYIPGSVTTLAEAGQDGPFLGSYVRTVYFGGTEADWNVMMDRLKNTALLKVTYDVLSAATVYFEQEDPLVPDISESGGLILPSDSHEESFAAHSKTDFGDTGACQHEGCGYTLEQFQRDCPADHATIATSTTCDVCGVAGTKVEPSTPVDPGKPDKPDKPENPDEPSKPDTPDKPSNPDKPGDSDDPNNPGKPSNPDKPDTPDTPSVPSTPGGSSRPSRPSTGSSSKSETIRQPDGSTVTITTQSDGTMTVKTGKTEIVRVTIPVKSVSASTVAMLVKSDGTTEVIKASAIADGKMVVPLSDRAKIKIVDNQKDFVDVAADAWFDEAVAFAAARELFAGTSSNSFSPEASMTRAMWVTVLARFDGVDTSTGSTWYANGAQWAIQRGITNGSKLGSDITREQLVVMLWRYLGSPSSTDRLDYSDAGQISDYAVEAMRWASANGIINGYAGYLNPQGNATRAEVAQFLRNFIEHLAVKEA